MQQNKTWHKNLWKTQRKFPLIFEWSHPFACVGNNKRRESGGWRAPSVRMSRRINLRRPSYKKGRAALIMFQVRDPTQICSKHTKTNLSSPSLSMRLGLRISTLSHSSRVVKSLLPVKLLPHQRTSTTCSRRTRTTTQRTTMRDRSGRRDPEGHTMRISNGPDNKKLIINWLKHKWLLKIRANAILSSHSKLWWPTPIAKTATYRGRESVKRASCKKTAQIVLYHSSKWCWLTRTCPEIATLLPNHKFLHANKPNWILPINTTMSRLHKSAQGMCEKLFLMMSSSSHTWSTMRRVGAVVPSYH